MNWIARYVRCGRHNRSGYDAIIVNNHATCHRVGSSEMGWNSRIKNINYNPDDLLNICGTTSIVMFALWIFPYSPSTSLQSKKAHNGVFILSHFACESFLQELPKTVQRNPIRLTEYTKALVSGPFLVRSTFCI